MDVGKDVTIKRGRKSMTKLSATVQGMMNQWAEDTFPLFQETMELMREGAPVQWARLYLEAVKLGAIRQTDINININRQKDREDLQALVRTKLSLPSKSAASEQVEYTPFVELPADKETREEPPRNKEGNP